MSVEALSGTVKTFNAKIYELKPHHARYAVLLICVIFSKAVILLSHIKSVIKYRMLIHFVRCMPQVYGAIIDTITYVKNVLSVEINSPTDNPLIFPDNDEAILGGNFHGEPLAFTMDYLGIALSEIAKYLKELLIAG